MVSDGTLYKRNDGARERLIEKAKSERRSALSVVTTSHSWTFVKFCPKNTDFLLIVVQLSWARKIFVENSLCC